MIRIGILGDIGSGKSFIANSFGYPVFNADNEVGKLYKKDRKIFFKLNKALPKYITQFPIKKQEVTRAILANKNNLRKIIKIIHPEIRKKMNIFLKKNKKSKLVILDIPLLLENKINKKKDILIFIQANKTEILKRLKKRQNFNSKVVNKFRKIQLSLDYKRKKFVILDIPLLLENKINRKKDILIFVESKKVEILKRLKKRKNFDYKIINKFRKIQLSLDYKKKKSKFIIKNNFTNRFIKKQIKYILKQIH